MTPDIEGDLAQIVACSTHSSKVEVLASKRLADDADIVDVMLDLIDKYVPRKLSFGRKVDEEVYEENVRVGLCLRGKATIMRGFPLSWKQRDYQRLLKEEFNVDI